MKRLIICILIVLMICSRINVFIHEIGSGKYTIDKDLVEQVSASIPNYITIDKVPQHFINAIVVVEDKRFYRHYGFDIIAITRATVHNLKADKKVQGGSTITQQLVKNLFLSNEKTMTRKFKELLLAMRLERQYKKQQILEMYINVIYYGSGAYGIQNASNTYFGKNVEELSLEECAMLAGLPQAPSAYNPNKYLEKAKLRQETVLKLMEKNGFIDKESVVEVKSRNISMLIPRNGEI